MFQKIKKAHQEIANYYRDKEKRKVAIVYLVLRLFVILCLIREVLLENYHNVFLCILTLVLLSLPYIIDDKLHISLPNTLEVIILLFIFAAEILGEIQNFYGIFPHWDMLLHTMNGFLAAGIGFSLIDILNQTERFHINMTPIFVALVSFCFSMTVGVVWEFFEYGCDRLTLADMQKDTLVTTLSSVDFKDTKPNVPRVIKDVKQTIIIYDDDQQEVIDNGYLDLGGIDTMEDLLVNFIGAFVFSVLGFFYIKNRDNYKIAENFIPTIKQKN